MEIIKGLKYSKEHEWVKLDGNKATIGITDFAQHSLGDIVYVELPEVGAELKQNDAAGVVESFKSASDIFTPISGTVTEVNPQLSDNPALVNEAPYESWICALEISDASELDSLMDADAYEQFCAEGE